MAPSIADISDQSAAEYCFGLIVGVWIFFRLEETLPKANRIAFSVKGFSEGVKTVITNRLTAGYTLAMGLFFGCFLGYINSSQQIFQDLYGTGKLFTVYFGDGHC